MPQTANTTQQRNNRPSTQQFLTEVESTKRKKWRAKLDKHRSQKDWTRESFARDFSELKSDIDTVEELITDVQTKIQRLQGEDWKIEQEPKAAKDVIDDYGGRGKLKDLMRMSTGEFTPFLKEINEVNAELRDLKTQENQWIKYKEELWNVAATKLFKVADDFQQEYVDSKVAKRQMEYVTELQEMFEDKIETKIENKVNEETEGVQELRAEVQKMNDKMEMLKEQNQQYHEITNFLMSLFEIIKENNPEAVDTAKERTDFEEPDNIDLTDDEEEEEEGKENDEGEEDDEYEQEDIADNIEDQELKNAEDEDDESQDSDDDPDHYVADLQGKSVEEQYNELNELKEHIDFEEHDADEIAEHTDVSKGMLVNVVLSDLKEYANKTFPEITDKYEDDEVEEEDE